MSDNAPVRFYVQRKSEFCFATANVFSLGCHAPSVIFEVMSTTGGGGETNDTEPLDDYYY